jgi:signal peptidase I
VSGRNVDQEENTMHDHLIKLWRHNRGFVLFVVLMALFRSAVADWNSVPSGSMRPTLIEGDRIVVNKLAYDLRIPFTHVSLYRMADPRRGEIVVFDSEKAGKRLVKRVIGEPGETVQLVDNRLLIDGREVAYRLPSCPAEGCVADEFSERVLEEDLGGLSHRVTLDPRHVSPLRSFGPVRVPEGHYLVLGDNRDNSADSRVYGFVARSEIVGRSNRVAFSVNYDNFYLPRGGRFWHSLQ